MEAASHIVLQNVKGILHLKKVCIGLNGLPEHAALPTV